PRSPRRAAGAPRPLRPRARARGEPRRPHLRHRRPGGGAARPRPQEPRRRGPRPHHRGRSRPRAHHRLAREPSMKTKHNLSLGPDTIQRLPPHGRPFLMVDTVEGYERAPHPTLLAARHVSANEPVFEGHFPGLHLWPGVYTIEGLGQSANLLLVIW